MSEDSIARQRFESRTRWIAEGCVLAAGAVAAFACLTWLSGHWHLTSFGANYIPMAPSTAAAMLLLSGATAALIHWASTRTVRIFGVVASALVGLGCLLAALPGAFGGQLALRRWLPIPDDTLGGLPVGEMAPLTAATFVVVSAASFCLALPRADRRQPVFLASVFSAGGMIIAVVVLLGYLAGRPLLLGGGMIPMALPTAAAFLAVTLAIFLDAASESWLPELARTGPLVASAPRQRGVRSGLTVIALFLVIAIAGSGVWYFRQQQAEARAMAEADMAAIADLKVQQIVNWRAERMDDVWDVLTTTPVSEVLLGVLAGRPSDKLSLEALSVLAALKRDRYERVELFDTQLRPRLAVPAAPLPLDTSAELGMKAALQVAMPILTDLHRGGEGTSIHLDLAVPLVAAGEAADGRRSSSDAGRPAAVILCRIDPRAFLVPLIQSWPTKSRSSESFLVRRDGEDVLFLSDLRYRPGTALTFRLPLSRTSLPASQAAIGNERVMEGNDYREVPVVAATRRIPASPWALVAKVDQSEIYAPFRQLALFVGLIVGVAILASGLGVGLVWRHQRLGEVRHALELERREKALAERMAYLLKHVNDIVLLFDENWRTLEANDRALETYGYTLAELQQRTLRDLRPPEQSEDFDRWAGSVEAVNRDIHRTLHQRKDGTRFPVEISVRSAELGGTTYYQSVIRDITDRVRAESEILALNAELEQRVADRTAALQEANSELQTFTFSVSHDLKTPLRGLDGYSRLLLEEYGDRLDGDARFYVGNIRQAATQMGQLIDDLLKYSRIERGALTPAAVNPRSLVSELIEERSEEVRARAVEVVVDMPCDRATADPNGIRQVLRNVIDNALKFTRDVPRPRIEVGSRCTETSCVLSIRDNGCGFDMRHSDRIFDIFQRLHRPEDYPGTGVGLAIVRKAVQRMGGRVWADSTPGCGATFFIEVPR